MSTESSFEYLRAVNFAASQEAPGERFLQVLIDDKSGARDCEIRYSTTPAGGGVGHGRHIHDDYEQIFYILTGTTDFEIDGKEIKAGPGSLVVIPRGKPHVHWNSGNEESASIQILSPLPDPGKPKVRPA